MPAYINPLKSPNTPTRRSGGVHLTPDQGEAVGGQNLVDGLEVGGTAGGAVARATGGDTLGLAAGVERSTRVTGLSADVGLGEAGDTALSVVNGGTQGADGTTVDAGGGARAADAAADGGGGGAGDGDVGATVCVDDALEGGAADGADVAHVSGAGEDGAGEGSEGRAAGGGGRAARGTTVAGRDETGGDSEADGAASSRVDVVWVTTADSGEGGGHALDGDNLELTLDETDLGGQGLGMGGAASKSLDDELVGGDIDEVGGDARGGGLRGEGAGLLDVQVVKSLLSLLKLAEAVGSDNGGGASSGHISDQGLVSDGNVDGVVLGDPSTGERVAGQGADRLDDLAGGDVPGDASMSLLGIKAQVALHGGQDLGVEVLRGLCGRTVDDGQDGGQETEKLNELHVC